MRYLTILFVLLFAGFLPIGTVSYQSHFIVSVQAEEEDDEGKEGSEEAGGPFELIGWASVAALGGIAILVAAKRLKIKVPGNLAWHKRLGWIVPLLAAIHGFLAFQTEPEWETAQLVGLVATVCFLITAAMGWFMGRGGGREVYRSLKSVHLTALITACLFTGLHVLGAF